MGQAVMDKPKLTIEQQGLAAAHGIQLRKDGKWGFRKLCAYGECTNKVADICYCADDFDAAVKKSQTCSWWTCSALCSLKNHYLDSYLEYTEIEELAELAQDHNLWGTDKIRGRNVKRVFKAPWDRELMKELNEYEVKLLSLWAAKVQPEDDADIYESDMCECEI